MTEPREIVARSRTPRREILGWVLGYIGGGMASAIFVLLVLDDVSAENFERIRWVGPWAADFFLIAAIPTFLWVKERGTPRARPRSGGYITPGIARVRQTLLDLEGRQGLALMFIIIQVTAAVGALAFGYVQDALGGKRIYRITLVRWIVAIVLIYQTPDIASALTIALNRQVEAQYVFLVVGIMAGLSLRSCQSATRTLVGLFSPLSRTAEFFGFWGLALKLAGFFGLLAIGLPQAVLELQTAVPLCVLLFAIALLLSRRIDEMPEQRQVV